MLSQGDFPPLQELQIPHLWSEDSAVQILYFFHPTDVTSQSPRQALETKNPHKRAAEPVLWQVKFSEVMSLWTQKMQQRPWKKHPGWSSPRAGWL